MVVRVGIGLPVSTSPLPTSRLVASVEQAIESLEKLCVPLYTDIKGIPALIGTGFFVQREDSVLLVSAAHVLEHAKTQEIYFYIKPNVKRFLSGSMTINRHLGSRESDLIDLAAVRLDSPNLPPYPSVQKYALNSSQLRFSPSISDTARYVFIGFPASRSRIRKNPDQVRVSPYAFIGRSAPLSSYTEKRIGRDTHICLQFDRKHSFDLHGAGRLFPKPQGISGSPIFLLFDEFEVDPSPTFSLVGIATTWDPKQRLLLGTGINSITELLSVASQQINLD